MDHQAIKGNSSKGEEGREKGTEDKRLKVGDTFQELIQILKEKRREPKILREEHKKDNLPIAWS